MMRLVNCRPKTAQREFFSAYCKVFVPTAVRRVVTSAVLKPAGVARSHVRTSAAGRLYHGVVARGPEPGAGDGAGAFMC